NMLIAFFQKSHLASRLLRDTIVSMNIKGGSLETYSETRWVSIYDTTNSIIRVRPAIDKIVEEKPDIFTNQEVFQIACDENDTFYVSCKRISLIFEPIKRVIHLLESRIANLADCFMGIVQIAASLRRIPTIDYYKGMHHNDKECRRLMNQLIKYKARVKPWKLEYSSNLTPFTWWDVVEDEHTDLQDLAKTMFAIVPSQANCERNFSILKWFTEGRRTRLQAPRLESMAQLHSFYISNVENELKFCDDFVETELRDSALNETIFAEMDNLDSNKCREEEDEMDIVNPTTNDITMALQDLVDLSDPIFGGNNNQGEAQETVSTDEEPSMEFE
ncbi:11696_t:CDS:2, partial [Gigaspora margarita]